MSRTDKLRVLDYLEHILEAIQRIHDYTEDVSDIIFFQNKLIQDGIIRNIEIMGEAAGNIERYHPDFSKEHSEVPWADIYLMRNRVAHGYFSVDLQVIWNTIENDIPELEQQIRLIYQKLNVK